MGAGNIVEELEEAIDKIKQDLDDTKKHGDAERKMLKNDLQDKATKSEIVSVEG